MALLRVVDFETSDLPPNGRVIEIGVCDVTTSADGSEPTISAPRSMLVCPGKEHRIRPEASAVNHLTDDLVAAAPPFMDAAAAMITGPKTPDYLVAHKADFERAFFSTPATWICTWKVALVLAPNAPGWSNQCLRYWLKLAVDKDTAMPPHRAGPDAYVTAHLLRRMLAKKSVQDMVHITEQPALLPRLGFGKHAMLPLADVPTDYLQWMVKQTDMDPDALHTARVHLARRQQEQRSRSPVQAHS